MAYQAGAFKGSPVSLGCMCAFAPYTVENVFLEGPGRGESTCPRVAAYRAPGAPMGVVRLRNGAGRDRGEQLGIDLPLEFRLRNAAEEGMRSVYGPIHKRIGLQGDGGGGPGPIRNTRSKLGPNQGRGGG